MEIQLKQRLIGAVVIFTLLIIFLPMALENDNEQQIVEQILEPPVKNIIQNDDLVNGIKNINSDVIDSDEQSLNNSTDQQADITTGKALKITDDITTTNNLGAVILKKSEKVSENLEKLIDRAGVKKSEYLKHLDTSSHVVNEDTIMARYNYDLNTKSANKKESSGTSTNASSNKLKSLAKIENSKNISKTKIPSTAKPQKSSDAMTKQAVNKSEEKYSAKKNEVSLIKPVSNSNDKPYKLISTNNKITRVYAIEVGKFNSKQKAVDIKNNLQNMGYPSYLRADNNLYTVYIGPELEKQYINELSRRIKEETDYKAEIVTHDSSWVVE